MNDKISYLEHVNYLVKAMPTEVPDDYRQKTLKESEHIFDALISAKGLKKRKVLIVGGAGYIGVPLTFYLLKRGYDVRCLDLLLYGNGHSIHGFLGEPGYEFVRGDMADANTVQTALNGVTDVLILAGLVGDPITRLYPEQSAAINDRALIQLLRNLDGKNLNRVVFISTCSNYGEIPENRLADENYELKPLSSYANSKVALESELLKMKNNVDFCGTVLRFATAFGLSGRMRFDLTVSEFTREMFFKKEIEVYDADTWRPYCHVRDFARAITTVLEAPQDSVYFDVFNAGGDINNFTKGMLVERIGTFLPDAEIKYVSGGFDRRNYKVDFSKIKNSLCFTPNYSVEEGVRELITALRDGFFADYEDRLNVYRNNEITYPAPLIKAS
jgi:nucleoside-diphosphate-sugar epimerase